MAIMFEARSSTNKSLNKEKETPCVDIRKKSGNNVKSSYRHEPLVWNDGG